MLKIAVCDDEPLDLNRIQDLVSEYMKNHPTPGVTITRFESSERLLERLEKETFHIYLLDILMNGKNGIEVGEVIRENDSRAAIIYLTVSPDYALASYSVDAQYYLLKPIEKEKFFRILGREIENLANEKGTYITVRTKSGIKSIRTDLIMYVEQNYHVFTYHLTNDTDLESVTSRASFDQQLQVLLKDSRFVKISSSMLVSLRCIKTINKKGLILQNGTELLIARAYSEAKHCYMEYMI
ncbi:MAG: LytTR family DNA-binding domain-containing protein [Clostridia bacterium]|nr:LytTR family DNA-binding domain-containing protein [Clostridia bacterium]